LESYGGLPTLLTKISQYFSFLPPQSMRWTPDPPLGGQPESIPVFAVVGRWKEGALRELVPDSTSVDALPDRLPHEVLLLFGQSDLIPYHIEFRRHVVHQHSPAAPGAAAPYQLSAEPIMFLELENVLLDTPIAASQFDYSAGDAEWNDYTDECLDRMRLERQEQTAARKLNPPL
jgi:hypothetical protein